MASQKTNAVSNSVEHGYGLKTQLVYVFHLYMAFKLSLAHPISTWNSLNKKKKRTTQPQQGGMPSQRNNQSPWATSYFIVDFFAFSGHLSVINNSATGLIIHSWTCRIYNSDIIRKKVLVWNEKNLNLSDLIELSNLDADWYIHCEGYGNLWLPNKFIMSSGRATVYPFKSEKILGTISQHTWSCTELLKTYHQASAYLY